ncbi:uncharacterized protein NEMAJ01_1868 [Nematocida major]|uniref:uncharacterized protein n=1 Tax=Nematocida major TaxID=1912982 RepID=UPI0020076794|nr:uncharacterized protein NEMAJ01_1868 [Nematocida major]KAH9386972.1 hypothetical protein NEMAJ01_1868 [Nematocida major]
MNCIRKDSFEISRVSRISRTFLVLSLFITWAWAGKADSSGVESTELYKKIRSLADKIDGFIDELIPNNPEKAPITRDEFMKKLRENDLQIIHNTNLSCVFVYSGPLLDYAKIPGMKEAVDDKVQRKLILKKAASFREVNMQEEKLCKMMDHPNTVRTFFSFSIVPEDYEKTGFSMVWLLQEYLEVSLPVLPNNPILNKLVEIDIRTIARDVARGIEYLHSKKIVHLDIKAQNVAGSYSKREGRIVYKLIDFGFSREIEPGQTSVFLEGMNIGTPPFVSPEIALESVHGYAADIWCFGFMMIVLSRIALPEDNAWICLINDLSNNPNLGRKVPMANVFAQFLRGSVELVLPLRTPVELASFIRGCMQRDGERRMTIQEVLKHPYLSRYVISGDPNPENHRMYAV